MLSSSLVVQEARPSASSVVAAKREACLASVTSIKPRKVSNRKPEYSAVCAQR